MKTKLPNRIDPFVNGAHGPVHNGTAKGQPADNSEPATPPPAADAAPPGDQGAGDRDRGGRFQLGCKPGPGNPFAKRVAALRKSLLDSVPEADVAKLGQRLLAQALEGDVVAAKLLLSYLIGKPGPTVDPDRLALEAVRLILSWPTAAEALAAVGAVRPEAVTELVERWAPDCPEGILEDSANPATLEGMERIRRRRESKGK